MQKSLVKKLVECSPAEECTENIEETRLVEINLTECNSIENKCKHNCCTLYIVLFWIIFTVNIETGSYFLCFHCYLKKMLLLLTIKWTYKWEKLLLLLLLLFLQRHDKSKKFRITLVKNRQKKHYKGIDIYYIGYITIKKSNDYENIHSVSPLYLLVNHASGYIEVKNGNKY